MAFIAGMITMCIFLASGKTMLGDLSHPFWAGCMFAWLFLVMLWLSFAVVRHADALAIKLGEPYGTLILTIAVISIEVAMIVAIMLTGKDNPELARDTMFAVLMIVLNGMVGVTLLVGGLRHREQSYNLSGANAFLSVIIPLSTLVLILPHFTTSTPDFSASTPLAIFLIAICIGLYAVFLTLQTVRHKDHFVQPGFESDDDDDEDHDDHHGIVLHSVPYHAVMLVACMLPIVILSKKMAMVLEHGVASLGAPAALAGFLVAILVLSPEGLGALKAAAANRLQRTVNICLGSAVATVSLTAPAVLVVGLITGKHVELGLNDVELILLCLTLGLSVVSFSSGRTNILQGAVHLIVFAAYVVLIFDT